MSTVLLIVLGIICVAEYHTHPPPTHKKIISPVPCPLNETSFQYFCCCFRFSFEDRCFIDFGFVLAPSWLPNRHFLASICGFTKSIEENPRRCCNDAAGMLRTDGKGRFGGGGAPPAKSLAQAKLFRSEERRAIVQDLTRLWAVGPANFCFFSYMSCKHVLQLCGSFVSKAQHRFHQSLVIT